MLQVTFKKSTIQIVPSYTVTLYVQFPLKIPIDLFVVKKHTKTYWLKQNPGKNDYDRIPRFENCGDKNRQTKCIGPVEIIYIYFL